MPTYFKNEVKLASCGGPVTYLHMINHKIPGNMYFVPNDLANPIIKLLKIK